MKKPQLNILVTITAVFTAFVLGFFLGRNYNHTDIQLSAVSPVPDTQPVETVPVQLARSSGETELPAEATSPRTAEEPQSQTELPRAEAEPDISASSGLININTATRAELETLPGIGEVLAQRIIDYREAYGPFTTVTQLTNVSGIGNKRLAAIIDLVTVG